MRAARILTGSGFVEIPECKEVFASRRDCCSQRSLCCSQCHHPEAFERPAPTLLRRTPYGVPESERGLDSGIYEDLIADGYICVSKNIRGRVESKGTFIMPPRPRDQSKPNSIDEGTDAYDTTIG